MVYVITKLAIRCIAETVETSATTVYNIRSQMLDMGGIKRKQGSDSINKKWDNAFRKSLKAKI